MAKNDTIPAPIEIRTLESFLAEWIVEATINEVEKPIQPNTV